MTQEESLAAGEIFINQLGLRYYRRYLGFSSVLSIGFFILFIVIPNFLCWYFFHSFITSSILLLLTISFLLNYLLKFYKRKIYGLRY